MALAHSKAEYYTHLPPHQNYVVLTPYYPPFNRNRCRILCTVFLILLAATVFFLWPCNPDVKIMRFKLNRVHVHTFPRVAVDISIFVTVKVRNTDVYSMDYAFLDVGVGYRGKRLGHVRSESGHVTSRGSSYVDAVLEFDGVELLSDVVFLLEDLAKGTVPFDTVTEIKGYLGVYVFQVPLMAKVSCEVLVNTVNQTIAHQNCYAR